MKMCEEMVRLREALTKMSVKWTDHSDIVTDEMLEEKKKIYPNISSVFLDTTMYRTWFEYRGYEISVIYGYGSWGGPNGFGTDPRLLEARFGMNEEPIGWLTADKVLAKLEEL